MMLTAFVGDYTQTSCITRIDFKLFSIHYYMVSVVIYYSVLWALSKSYMQDYLYVMPP